MEFGSCTGIPLVPTNPKQSHVFYLSLFLCDKQEAKRCDPVKRCLPLNSWFISFSVVKTPQELGNGLKSGTGPLVPTTYSPEDTHLSRRDTEVGAFGEIITQQIDNAVTTKGTLVTFLIKLALNSWRWGFHGPSEVVLKQQTKLTENIFLCVLLNADKEAASIWSEGFNLNVGTCVGLES